LVDKGSSFPEKKQKRLFRYAEDGRIETCYSKPRRANAFASFLEKKSTRLKLVDKGSSFPEKKQKRLFRYAEDGRIETCYSKLRRANAFASFLEKKNTS
jgi:hypothetical protein